jgi:DNA-binding transcriptional LysR family regulator
MRLRMTAAPSWDHYRAFLAAWRSGSFSGAARTLGLAQPTVGRQLDALEEALGLALFTRSPAGLVLTEAGAALIPDALSMEAAAEALVRAASARPDTVEGVVRIAASEVVGGLVLPPILASLRAQHPGLVFELALSNRNEDLLRRDADLAVRMARPVQTGLFARKLGEVELGLFAHASYAKRHGLPATPAELLHHPIIGFDRDDTAARSVAGAQTFNRELFAYRCDNDLAQIAALKAGFGLGGCQAPLAARDPQLIRVLGAHFSFHLEMWLVAHEDLKTHRRVRAVLDHLGAQLPRYLRGEALAE